MICAESGFRLRIEGMPDVHELLVRYGAEPWVVYVVAAFGAIAMYLLFLPPERRTLRALGELIGVAAIAGLIVWMAGTHASRLLSSPLFSAPLLSDSQSPPDQARIGINPMFYVFGLIALGSSAKAMTDPRPLYCVLFFVLVALSVAAVLLMALAEFLAVGLVLITAGAIMVLFVFVVMLAQKEGSKEGSGEGSRPPLAALLLGFLLLAALGAAIPSWPTPIQELAVREVPPAAGQVAPVGQELFSRHLLALELAGVLLIMAIVGSIAVVRRRIVRAM